MNGIGWWPGTGKRWRPFNRSSELRDGKVWVSFRHGVWVSAGFGPKAWPVYRQHVVLPCAVVPGSSPAPAPGRAGGPAQPQPGPTRSEPRRLPWRLGEGPGPQSGRAHSPAERRTRARSPDHAWAARAVAPLASRPPARPRRHLLRRSSLCSARRSRPLPFPPPPRFSPLRFPSVSFWKDTVPLHSIKPRRPL